MEKQIENELYELEKKYWAAIRDKDFATAKSLTADPCLVAGAQGIGKIDKSTFVKIMEGARHSLHEFQLSNPKAIAVSDSLVLLAYDVHEEVTVEGERLSIDASQTSAWIRQNGRWLCALHTESLHGDPWGRDRKPREAGLGVNVLHSSAAAA